MLSQPAVFSLSHFKALNASTTQVYKGTTLYAANPPAQLTVDYFAKRKVKCALEH